MTGLVEHGVVLNMHSGDVDRLYTLVPSPVGELLLTSNGDALTGLFPASHRELPSVDDLTRDNGHFTGVKDQLAEWFRGRLLDFNVPVALRGTDFQRSVWKQLLRIPPGVTCTYGELATQVGRPSASRAVGAAVGKNPISLIIPCHRVVGTDGSLTGYAGGLDVKRWLLEHEARVVPHDPFFAMAQTSLSV